MDDCPVVELVLISCIDTELVASDPVLPVLVAGALVTVAPVDASVPVVVAPLVVWVLLVVVEAPVLVEAVPAVVLVEMVMSEQ